MERTEETRMVKQELAKVGIVAKVGHGRGTGWGWLEVDFDIPYPQDCYCPEGGYPMCKPCRDARDEAESKAKSVVLNVTNRTGDYDGRTLIQARRVHQPKVIELVSRAIPTVDNQVRHTIRMHRADRTARRNDRRNGSYMYY